MQMRQNIAWRRVEQELAKLAPASMSFFSVEVHSAIQADF